MLKKTCARLSKHQLMSVTTMNRSGTALTQMGKLRDRLDMWDTCVVHSFCQKLNIEYWQSLFLFLFLFLLLLLLLPLLDYTPQCTVVNEQWHLEGKINSSWPTLACEQALGGRVVEGKEGELATTSQKFEFCLHCSCGSPLSELSDFGQFTQTRNKIQCNKHV